MEYVYLIEVQDFVWHHRRNVCAAKTIEDAENWLYTYAKNNDSTVEKIVYGHYVISGRENFDVQLIYLELV